jgi:hypothetical protein
MVHCAWRTVLDGRARTHRRWSRTEATPATTKVTSTVMILVIDSIVTVRLARNQHLYPLRVSGFQSLVKKHPAVSSVGIPHPKPHLNLCK